MGKLLTEAGGALLTEAGGDLLAEGAGAPTVSGAAVLSGTGTLTVAGTAVRTLTVTATASGTGSGNATSLAVRVVNNAAMVQNGASVNSETASVPQQSITPHASGSLVYGSAVYGSATAFSSLDANTTSIVNHVDSANGLNYGSYKSTSATTTSPTTYGWAAPTGIGSGLLYIASAEILGNGGTIAEDASQPAAVFAAAKTATTAPFTPPGASVLAALVSVFWQGTPGVTVTVTDSASAYTWTQLAGEPTTDIATVWVGIPVSVTVSGAAALSGSGVLGAAALVTQPAAAALAGTGTLTAVPVLAIPGAAVLLGSGALTASAAVTAPGAGSASLTGTGVLGTAGSIGFVSSASLSGTGVLGAQETGITQQAAALSGQGTLTVAAKAALKFTAGLFGGGFLSIPQVAGGLVNGVGGAGTPMALPGSSQVAVAPPGSTNWQWLGTLGQVTALTYSYVCPGGADKMSMTIMVPASYRTQLFNPGWQVKIVRGGHDVWHGKLDEPQPSASGWTLTAVGNGNRGTDFTNFYAPGDLWPAGEPDEIINRAIGRGLPWANPGYNSSPIFSQFWMGQGTDPGSQTVTAFLNLITSRGGLTWYVNSQPGGIYGSDDLQIFPLPTVPNRLLVATTPVTRTLGGYVNTLVIRYQSSADNTTASPPVAASYNVVSAINQQSVAAHGTLEQYVDLADASVMTSSQAQAVGNQILAAYTAASFAGPFEVSYGQLLNMGGQAVDIGTDQAGGVAKLVLTDFAYGGSVTPSTPVTFVIGSYAYDDFKQTATVTPYQSLNESLSGMLSAWNTTNTPVTVAS